MKDKLISLPQLRMAAEGSRDLSAQVAAAAAEAIQELAAQTDAAIQSAILDSWEGAY